MLFAAVTAEAQPRTAPAQLGTHARMVSAVNVRLRLRPSFDSPTDSLVPIGTVVVVNHAKQPRDTSWVYVELTWTATPGYIHASMLRRIPQGGGPAMAEEIATERLARRGDPFPWKRQLFDMLTYQREMPSDSERRGRVALLWVKSFASLLGSIPPGEHVAEPYWSWFGHQWAEGFISFDESTKAWRVVVEPLFAVHAQHRETRSADEIAWTIRGIGMRDDCGPSVTCNIAALDTLDAAYLRRHPDGAHAIEALARIRTVVARAMGEPDGADGFNRVTDCEALEFSLASVRAAVAGAVIAPRSGARGVPASARLRTLESIDSLAARCTTP